MPASQTWALAVFNALLFASAVSADFRLASVPNESFQVQNAQNAEPFVTKKAVYMEPSVFDYQGLKEQKKNNYDNFLRSNIDNEQDNRNFDVELGRDMLPCRTMENNVFGETVTAKVGIEQTIPVRWNNPHSSEVELNVWLNGILIDNKPVVVPIKKPACSGEGYQDSVITYTVPADFAQLAAKVPGFKGCKKLGDCTLQIYGHSVEPRTYAACSPFITDNDDSTPAAADASAIQPATTDVGYDLGKLPRDTCLGMGEAASNIASAVPRYARLVSDQYNHAYQNSDYSPYSGQQHEAISRNMQAACIVRMVVGNRGELGKSILTQETKDLLNKLAGKVNALVANYETIANNILNNNQQEPVLRTTGVVGNQKLATCVRCLKVASVQSNRQQTATYIPSFDLTGLSADKIAQIKQGIQQQYRNLISPQNVVQIYVQTLNDMRADFTAAEAKGVKYLGPKVKYTLGTMVDATGFRKVDAAGKTDGGKYAATMAKKEAERIPPSPSSSPEANALPSASPMVILIGDVVPVVDDSIKLPANPDDSYTPVNPGSSTGGAGNGTDPTTGQSGAGERLSGVVAIVAAGAIALAML